MRYAFVAILLLPAPVFAWNSIGHQAVAKLAYDQLNDGQKATLFKILKTHPHYDKFLAMHRPAEVSEPEWVFVRSSIWSDWIRPRGVDNRGPGIVKFHRGEDHYVNIPLIDPKDAEYFTGKTLVSPDLANILSALQERCNDLRTKNAADEDKAVAVCWINHLVGDIHQPLHNVAYFSNTKAFRKGDLGGNKFGVRIAGKRWRLHTFWDEVLGEDPNYTDDEQDRQVKTFKQAVALVESLRGLELKDADKTALADNVTFVSWSQEGFQLAKSMAYQMPDGSGLIPGVEVPFNGFIPADAPELGKEYLQKARAVAEVRAYLAGQRLAARLKMLLSK